MPVRICVQKGVRARVFVCAGRCVRAHACIFVNMAEYIQEGQTELFCMFRVIGYAGLIYIKAALKL